MKMNHQRVLSGRGVHWGWMLVLGCSLALGSSGAGAAQSCNASVIAETMPTGHFLDNGDGTVVDKATGLTWKRCAEGQTWDASASACSGTAASYTWQQALVHAQSLNSSGGFAGKTDWRLPNSKELSTIVERACANPAINLTVFPNTPTAGFFWSASPYLGQYRGATTDSMAWVESYSGGNALARPKSDTLYLRVVRGGL